MRFIDIPGNAKVKNELIQTVNTERISHAQLFFGEEGSSALALSLAYCQYISCENRSSSDSCGECVPCKQFQSLTYPDLHFTYPAGKSTTHKTGSCKEYLPIWREFIHESPFGTPYNWSEKTDLEGKFLHIGVAESREILQDFSLKSYSGKRKILILWLPELLHTSASNKLLKFIEEPEPGSLIILVSHDFEKILSTISSRTQFTRVSKNTFEEVKNYLISNYSANEGQAEVASLASNGNLGNAIEIIKNPERELEYARQFVNWMRLAVMAKLPEIVKFSEELSKMQKDSLRGFLKFSLRIIDHCLQLRYINKPTGDSIFESAGFKIEKFAPYINNLNAKTFYEEMSKAIYELERNVNPKFILLDLSIEMSKAIRRK